MTEVTYVRSLLGELGIDISEPTPVHVDNKGAVDDSHNKSGRRTRHVNIKFHAVRDAVRHGEVKVIKVRGGVSADTEQLADLFTKATSRAVHNAIVPRAMGLTYLNSEVTASDRSQPVVESTDESRDTGTDATPIGVATPTAGSTPYTPTSRLGRRNC